MGVIGDLCRCAGSDRGTKVQHLDSLADFHDQTHVMLDQQHRYLEFAPDIINNLQQFLRLDERRRQLAGTLSGGEQQMLAVGRALMAKPKMILMDEPSMGLSPLLVKEIFAIIQEVNKQGITILLVEQNAKMALAISDRAYVLETGNISIEGNAADLLNDPRVKKAYLGQ